MVKHNLYTKIFRQLRGYFIRPHLNVWRRLRKRLFNKDFPDSTSQLKDFKASPPPELFNQVLETHQQMQLQARFAALRDLENRPGENAFESILSLIAAEKNRQPAVLRSIPFYKKMIAAAAFLIILISCFFILKIIVTSGKETPGIVQTTNTATTGSPEKKDSISNTTQKEKLLVNSEPAHISRQRSYYNADNHLSFYNASIDGNDIKIENNDLLFSFASYPYRYAQSNPWNNKKGTVVKINSYTDINISPYMSAVISDLYKVKRNGKATFKAKRAKLKINRWRKADSRKFDKKEKNNPLDIIDLGENVY